MWKFFTNIQRDRSKGNRPMPLATSTRLAGELPTRFSRDNTVTVTRSKHIFEDVQNIDWALILVNSCTVLEGHQQLMATEQFVSYCLSGCPGKCLFWSQGAYGSDNTEKKYNPCAWIEKKNQPIPCESPCMYEICSIMMMASKSILDPLP